ncbi:MAG: 3-deoxy-D-manno-octulosonic acid transferase [Flavobacteriaceae bacterium]
MMFHITYNLILHLCYPVIHFLGFFSNKHRLFISGRKMVFNQLKSKGVNRGNWAWFHVASLGEFEQARPLILDYKKAFPHEKILLTFFSPSGYEIQKKFSEADCVCYLPWDTLNNVNRFLDFCNLNRAIFVKYEFWVNYLNGLYRRKIPVYSISSIFRPNQLFFKSYGKAYRKILYGVKHFFVQNDESKVLLKSIGIDQLSISGDTRLDRVYDLAQNHKRIEIIEKFLKNQECFVAGSTWPDDYELMDNFLKKPPPIKLIIVPHEISKSSIENLEKKISVPYAKWSDFDDESDTDKKVIIIDTIGKLANIYYYAKFAYVGGGMRKGGLHNTLEPAAYGIPVIIGRYFDRFQEAVVLEKKGGISSVKSPEEFEKISTVLLNDQKLVEQMGEINQNYIKSSRGASKYIIETIKKHSTK